MQHTDYFLGTVTGIFRVPTLLEVPSSTPTRRRSGRAGAERDLLVE